MTQVMMTTLMTEQNAMEVMWNGQKVTARVQKLLRMIIAALDATDCCVFIGKDKTKWGKVKTFTHIRCRWQNILTKLFGVIGRARKATTPFEAWNYLITDGIFYNIAQHTNQYILIIQPNFSRAGDTKPTDKTAYLECIGVPI